MVSFKSSSTILQYNYADECCVLFVFQATATLSRNVCIFFFFFTEIASFQSVSTSVLSMCTTRVAVKTSFVE